MFSDIKGGHSPDDTVMTPFSELAIEGSIKAIAINRIFLAILFIGNSDAYINSIRIRLDDISLAHFSDRSEL